MQRTGSAWPNSYRHDQQWTTAWGALVVQPYTTALRSRKVSSWMLHIVKPNQCCNDTTPTSPHKAPSSTLADAGPQHACPPPCLPRLPSRSANVLADTMPRALACPHKLALRSSCLSAVSIFREPVGSTEGACMLAGHVMYLRTSVPSENSLYCIYCHHMPLAPCVRLGTPCMLAHHFAWSHCLALASSSQLRAY